MQAVLVELVLARMACATGQRVDLRVKNRVADGAGLQPLKFLVDVLLPQGDSIHHAAVLRREHGDDLQHPPAPPVFRDSQTLPALDLDIHKRKAPREANHNFHRAFVLKVGGERGEDECEG